MTWVFVAQIGVLSSIVTLLLCVVIQFIDNLDK